MKIPPRARRVEEVRAPGSVPLWVQPEWAERWPWLVQGTTGRGDDPAAPFDLGLSGKQQVGAALDRWHALRAAAGMPACVHARQVHGARIAEHHVPLPIGLTILEGWDGHLTRLPGVLVTVSVADCVPVFVVDPGRRAICLLHAGWRGTAAGIVEHGLRAVGNAHPGELWVHCGPAICGDCYEVGPEVHAAINPGCEIPDAAAPIDLRAAIVRRTTEAGVSPRQITFSAHCTRCGSGRFFSHRGGASERQMGVLGIA